MRLLIFAIAIFCGLASVPAISRTASADFSSLEKTLAAWSSPDERPREYKVAMVDLNGDSIPDAVVLITDRSYCGTGGCSLLVLKGTKNGFVVLSESSISREPIYVLRETMHGWHSLAIMSSGGGGPAKLALMRFDGKQYPLNPSMQPPANRSSVESASPLNLLPHKW